jgi:hypothetical protein
VQTGQPLYSETPNSTNFAVWWDADLLRELEDGTSITKWNWTTRTTSTLLTASGAASNNGTKSNPSLLADILGDWREEVIWRSSDNLSLRIYTTTIPAENRIYTLLHDRQYRMAVAWQNVGYNQPPHPGFHLGVGMNAPPVPNIITSLVAPTLSLPADITLEATGPEGAAADFTATAQDLIGTPLAVSYSVQPGSVFPIGVTPVNVSAADIYGTTVTGTFNVTVRDTTAPAFVSLTASPDTIWPPHHQMVAVTLSAQVTDAVDAAPATRIVSVTSSEPVKGTGDGDISPDWKVTGDLTLDLRAERAGKGAGRVYTVTVESRDDFGNTSVRTVTVAVPVSQ